MTAAPKSRRPAPKSVGSWFRDASLKQWFKRVLLAGLLGIVAVLALLLVAYTLVSLPDEPDSLQTTLVLDSRGVELAELFKDENRVDVPLDEVADVVEKAVVSTEDRHFYEHSGLDPIGITRALVNDVRGKELQGGSTITQQLVKNTYLNAERSFVRKAREAVLAVKAEQQMSKREILERYLNTIYFGRGAHGIEKAAELYFGKKAADLQLHEASLLAGLIRAPESADPVLHEEEARNRRAIVLNAMVRSEVIDEAESEATKAMPLGAIDRPTEETSKLTGPNAHVVAMVRRWAVREFGERATFGGGLRIETTIDGRLQTEAETAIREVLGRPDDPAAALVTMADDGAVLAMIGGQDFQASQRNLATNSDRPQAGSTFKPFVLAAALTNGIPVTQRYTGPAREAVEFDGEPSYEVDNYDNKGYGNINLTDATVNSVNTVYAKLASEIGLEAVARTAHDLGVDSDLPMFPSMSLGTANVSPYEMVRSYMTLANRGQRVTPYYVRRVTDADGNLLFEASPSREAAYPEEHADVVNHVLQQTVERGTGRAADIGRPVAGKTGTTNGNTDAWFVGYTPRVGTAVWLGYPESTERKMVNVHGRQVTGGSFPAQIWGRYMKAAVADVDTGDFTEPREELLEAPQKADEREDGDGEGDEERRPSQRSTTTAPRATTTTAPEVDGSTTTTSEPEATTTTSSTAPPTTTTTTRPPVTTSTTAAPAAGPSS